jgi:PAS domain S-box-containing protein
MSLELMNECPALREECLRLKKENELLLNYHNLNSERLKSIFDQIPKIAVQGYSVDHKVTYWNSYSTELYGYSSEEALGQKIEDLIIPDEMCNEVRHAIDNFITTEIGIPSAEVLLKHKDGSMLPVYSQYILIKDYNSRPEMFCAWTLICVS